MGLFDFLNRGARKPAPAQASAADHAAEVKAERARDDALRAEAMARFRANGSSFTAFTSLVNDILRLYKSPHLPVQPTSPIFAQTDDIITVAYLVLDLKKEFPGDLEFDDAEMMRLSVVDLAHRCGLTVQAAAAPTATPGTKPLRGAPYPVGPREKQAENGMLAAIFGAFRQQAPKLEHFVTLVRSLMRNEGCPVLPADPNVPILQQKVDPTDLEALLDLLADEFSANLTYDERQLKRLTIRDIAIRCKAVRS